MLGGPHHLSAGDDASPVARIDAIEGAASVRHPDGTTSPLTPGAALYEHDLLVTKPGAKLALMFADRTTFALGEAAQLRLDAIHYDPSGKDSKLTLSVLQGSFAFVAG